jgi:hypothetical protein
VATAQTVTYLIATRERLWFKHEILTCSRLCGTMTRRGTAPYCRVGDRFDRVRGPGDDRLVRESWQAALTREWALSRVRKPVIGIDRFLRVWDQVKGLAGVYEMHP